jgi:uncharacterized damage-inducible protein DinB
MGSNIKHTIKLLEDHFGGDPWIDVTIIGELNSLSAKKAAAKTGSLNSIWEIVNHMISWRKALISRVKGKAVKYSENNFIDEVIDKSQAAWKNTISNFRKSQDDIISYLKKNDDKLLENVSPTSGYTYYELVMAILIHDSYHLGQIVLIKKLLNDTGR